MEMTREQFEEQLQRMYLPEIIENRLLAHDAALRDSRGAMEKNYKATLRHVQLENDKLHEQLAQATAKCEALKKARDDANTRYFKEFHNVDSWHMMYQELKQQLAQATARVEELDAIKAAAWDDKVKANKTIQALQHRITALEGALKELYDAVEYVWTKGMIHITGSYDAEACEGLKRAKDEAKHALEGT